MESLKFFALSTILVFLLFSVSLNINAQDNQNPPEAGMIARDYTQSEMVYVPAGKVRIGINRETFVDLLEDDAFTGTPESQFPFIMTEYEYQGVFDGVEVEIPAFWIDRFEVTIEQYEVRTEMCIGTGMCSEINLDEFPQLTISSDQPQVAVNWFDALRFCLGRGSRLPTEFEWEYAARGPDNFLFPWGNKLIYKNVANTHNSTGTYPVGSIAENVSWIGVYDMVGNASEWVEDRFVPYDYSSELAATWNNNHNIDKDRIIRGGSFQSTGLFTTTVARVATDPRSSKDVGIRCARSTDPRS